MGSTPADIEYPWNPENVAHWPVPPADDPDCLDPECDYENPCIIKVRPHLFNLSLALQVYEYSSWRSTLSAPVGPVMCAVRGCDGRLLHDQNGDAADAMCGVCYCYKCSSSKVKTMGEVTVGIGSGVGRGSSPKLARFSMIWLH